MLMQEEILGRQQGHYGYQHTRQYNDRYQKDSEQFYKSMPDNELIAACQNHNEKAFEQLIKRYDPVIISRIYRYVSNYSDRADIRQDALIKIWQSIGALRKREAFRVWLHRLVTHLIYDYLCQKSQIRCDSLDRSTFPDDERAFIEREIPDASSVPDKLCEDHELACELRTAIAKLPSRFKDAVLLREFAGLSYEDIAQRTGAEIGTVKSRISRARHKVRAEMEDYLTAGMSLAG
jgi:RNA polymerase sigma-70 factor, ECF subfamily